MADFVSVLRRAVGNLDNNTEATRQAIYGKARTALRAQLEAIEPPLGPEEVDRQIRGLDEAIEDLEKEFAGADSEEAQERTEPETSSPAAGAQASASAAAAAASSGAHAPATPDRGFQPAPPPPHNPPSHDYETPETDHAAADAGGWEDSYASRHEPAASAQYDTPPGRASRQTEYYDEEDVAEKGGSGRFVAWIILGLVIVGIAGVGFWQRDTVSQIVDSLSSGDATEDGGKIADRLPGDADTPDQQQPAQGQSGTSEPQTPSPSTSAPASQPQSPPPATAADGDRVAQALLIEESAAGVTPASTLGGSVDWVLADDTEAIGGTEKVIRGTVRVPEKDISLSVSIRRNEDQALPASHLVELVFETGPNFTNGGISNVPGLIMKATPRSTGQPLVGAVVPVMDGYFLVGLSESELDQTRNIEEMKSRGFIDVPIIYEDGGRAMLSLAKGETGTRVFNEAFAAWGE
ncbi:hypothetical protein [Microbaculum marinum]|uniref:CheA signal transduction histidine kinase n=1 Tax=Microbaculum marinum TaxID=1764581 RepID=A0AAW9RYV9_9HYPH